MGSPWIDGNFTFNLSDNLIFKKDDHNYIDALGIQQLNTIGNIYFLDIYLSKNNCVEMHYHPNASELTYCISGSVEVAFINPNDNEWQSFTLEKGDAVSIPQGFWHVACALTEDVHLLATHDTNNLETVFGSDLLRITPTKYFSDIYCLNERLVKEALAPIQDTIIIGPPSGCERDGKVKEVHTEKTMSTPTLKKAKRPEVYKQVPKEAGENIKRTTSLTNDNPSLQEMNNNNELAASFESDKEKKEDHSLFSRQGLSSERQTIPTSNNPKRLREEDFPEGSSHVSDTGESVPYGGTLLRPIHLCKNCLKQY